jgi:hypothetical protein
MNVNFVYSDFSDNGRALPNCSAQHPNFHWFDSTNFFSSYLNDDENNFTYWEDTEKFNIVKHKLNSVISNPTEPFFFMVSHPGLCYNEMDSLHNLGIKPQIIKRLKTNQNFYLVYLLEHESDSISGLNVLVDKLNKLGISHKTIICNNNSRIKENFEKVKKIHNYDSTARVHKLNFLTWSTLQVLTFENSDFKAYPFEWKENKDGKFFMCRNKGGKPHRMAMLAFIRAFKEFENNVNYSFIGNPLYGDLVRKMKDFFSFQFIIDNSRDIFELMNFYKEDDYESGLNWVDEKTGEFKHKNLAPIYLVPELHEAFGNSYMNIVTESAYFSEEEVVHITEKSFRPFFYYQFPIFLASPYHVKQLKDWGFDLFDDLIDHSYDLEEDDMIRFQMLTKELLRINSDKQKFIDLYPKLKDRFFKNKEVFLNLAHDVKKQDIEFFKNFIIEYKEDISNKPII